MEEAGAIRWAVCSATWQPGEESFEEYLSLLPHSARSEILKFRFAEDRKRALISRLLQRAVVLSALSIPLSNIVIGRTQEGKPYLFRSPYPGFNFNISHDGAWVAIASESLCLVGLDLMKSDKTRVKEGEPLHHFFRSFRKCYTPLEWATVEGCGPNRDRVLDQFFRFWCLKESYIKAVGVGLGLELGRLEFYFKDNDPWGEEASLRLDGEEQTQWRFSLQRLGTDHWVCVAKGPPSCATPSYQCEAGSDEASADTHAYAKALGQRSASFTHITMKELADILTFVEVA